MLCPLCHKSLAHRSSLSRHVNGSKKRNLKPCRGVTHHTEPQSSNQIVDIPQSSIELTAHDLQSQEATKNPSPFVSATMKEVFDGNINITNSQIISIPSNILQSVYMNKNHPEYWNVVMTNIDTKLIQVYDGNTWSHIYFEDWAWSFTNYARCLYFKKFVVSQDLSVRITRVMSENRKEVYSQLNKTLLGPMRQIIKKRHNIR
jgi:hypothetical protein